MFVVLGQAEEGTDEVYAQVSLVPESEVSFVHILCIVWFHYWEFERWINLNPHVAVPNCLLFLVGFIDLSTFYLLKTKMTCIIFLTLSFPFFFHFVFSVTKWGIGIF